MQSVATQRAGLKKLVLIAAASIIMAGAIFFAVKGFTQNSPPAHGTTPSALTRAQRAHRQAIIRAARAKAQALDECNSGLDLSQCSWASGK